MIQTIYLKPTNTCNLSCSHCFVDHSKKDMPNYYDKVLAFLKQIEPQDLHLILHGGEPMLVPIEDTTKFFQQASRLHSIYPSIQTNLVYEINQKKINLFTNIFNGKVGTSLDSTGRFNNRTFALWKKNLRILNENYIFISICFCLTDASMKDWPPEKLLKFCSQYNIKTLIPERQTGNTLPSTQVVEKYLYDLYRLYKKKYYHNLFIPFFDDIEDSVNGIMRRSYCHNCEKTILTINSDGSISGCPNSADNISWGNLDQGYKNILKSTKRKQSIIEEKTYREDCLKCEFFNVCGGDCHLLKECYFPKKVIKEIL